MADVRFCVGFSSACKQAREGGGLPGYCGRASRGRALRPFLPPDIIRLIDALVRRLEHEDTLLHMNGGVLGTTLCEAARAGGILDVRFLLARGADLEARTVLLDEYEVGFNWTALNWAAESGRLAVCRHLLDRGAAEKDAALVNAASNGHAPVVALLLDRGADIHTREEAPLGSAAQEGHAETVALLLDRGADIHVDNDAPLYVAAQNGHTETVRLLLDRGAERGADNEGALGVACLQGQLETVRFLLDHGADIHADNEGALRNSRHNGHAAVVALLLSRGALEPHL